MLSVEKIEKIKSVYESANADLKAVEDFYNQHRCLPEEITTPEETFEKGYVNGISYILSLLEGKNLNYRKAIIKTTFCFDDCDDVDYIRLNVPCEVTDEQIIEELYKADMQCDGRTKNEGTELDERPYDSGHNYITLFNMVCKNNDSWEWEEVQPSDIQINL